MTKIKLRERMLILEILLLYDYNYYFFLQDKNFWDQSMNVEIIYTRLLEIWILQLSEELPLHIRAH
jgi:hypothetical protein